MTYTLVELPVPAESFKWLKEKMFDGGYSHRIGIDHIDMTHIALVPMKGFEFSGNPAASLTDVYEEIVAAAFRAGHKEGARFAANPNSQIVADHRDKALSAFLDPESDDDPMRDLFYNAAERMQSEIAANIEARNQPAYEIIENAAKLLKPQIDNANTIHVNAITHRQPVVTTTIGLPTEEVKREADGSLSVTIDLTGWQRRPEEPEIDRNAHCFRLSWITNDGGIGTTSLDHGENPVERFYNKTEEKDVNHAILVQRRGADTRVVRRS